MLSEHGVYNENFGVVFGLGLVVDGASWGLGMNMWTDECVTGFGIKMRGWRSLEWWRGFSVEMQYVEICVNSLAMLCSMKNEELWGIWSSALWCSMDWVAKLALWRSTRECLCSCMIWWLISWIMRLALWRSIWRYIWFVCGWLFLLMYGLSDDLRVADVSSHYLFGLEL